MGHWQIPFLHEVIYNKEDTYNNEWESNRQDNPNAYANRMVPVIIEHKDKWAQPNSYYYKDDTTNIFPPPSNNKYGY